MNNNSRFLLLLTIMFVIFSLRVAFLPEKPPPVSTATGQNYDYIGNTKIYSDAGNNAIFFPQIRQKLSAKVDELYGGQTAPLIKGYLLGIDEFDRDFKQELITTGTVHVVVVSGFNVTLVASSLLSLAQFLGRKKALVISLLGILVYTLITGAQPPTVRAAIMGSLAFGAQALGRPKASRELLFLSALLMLIVSPGLLGNLSFQLSVMATLGVIQFSPFLTDKLKFLGVLKGDLATTLAAQALVVPLLFFHFGQISLISPLVNVLVLWTVPIATILGFLSLIISFLLVPLAQLLAWGNFVFLQFFILVVNFFSSITPLLIKEGNWYFLIGYYLVLIGFVMSLREVKDDEAILKGLPRFAESDSASLAKTKG